uniref:Helitron helicase n=1 Tax=Steinernema glaseri TaxID=37863 RepID=A0A1I8ARU1_9BILA
MSWRDTLGYRQNAGTPEAPSAEMAAPLELFEKYDEITVRCIADGTRWLQIAATMTTSIYNCMQVNCNACVNISSSGGALSGRIVGEHNHSVDSSQGVSNHWTLDSIDEPLIQFDEEPRITLNEQPLIIFDEEPHIPFNEEPLIQFDEEPQIHCNVEPQIQFNEEQHIQFNEEQHIQSNEERRIQSNEERHIPPNEEQHIQFGIAESNHRPRSSRHSLQYLPSAANGNSFVTINLFHHMSQRSVEYRLEFLRESGEQLTLKQAVENVIDRNNLRSQHMSLIVWVKRAGTNTDVSYDDILIHGATYDMFTTVGAAANIICFPSLEDGGAPVFPVK